MQLLAILKDKLDEAKYEAEQQAKAIEFARQRHVNAQNLVAELELAIHFMVAKGRS